MKEKGKGKDGGEEVFQWRDSARIDCA